MKRTKSAKDGIRNACTGGGKPAELTANLHERTRMECIREWPWFSRGRPPRTMPRARRTKAFRNSPDARPRISRMGRIMKSSEPSRASRPPGSRTGVAECAPKTLCVGQPRIDPDVRGFNPLILQSVGGGEPPMDTNEHEGSAFGSGPGAAAAVCRGPCTRCLLCDLRYLLSSRRRFRAQRSFRPILTVRPMAAASSASWLNSRR